MTKLIELIPEKCFPPARGGVGFDSILLKPGINYQLSPVEIDRLLAHPDFPRYTKNGGIRVIESETDPKEDTIAPQAPMAETADLSGFKVGEDDGETGEIIRKTADLKILDRWLDKEQRKTVRGQLEKRIAAIKKGDV